MKKVQFMLFMATVALLASCSSGQEVKTLPLSQYSVAHPAVRDIQYQLEFPGYLQSELVVDLLSRVEGYLQEIRFTAGSSVAKGDTLFVIEPRNYKNKVQQAEAQLLTSKANLALAETTLSRMQDAFKSNAVSEIDVIEATTNVDQCKAAVQSAEAQLETAQTNLSYCYILAPESGRVTRSLVDKGNYIAPHTQLATFYKDHQMYVYFSIEASKLIWAQNEAQKSDSQVKKAGQPFSSVEVKLTDSQGNEKYYPGQLDYLSPSANISTGTVDMRAVLKNDKRELNNGVYVKVTFPYKDVKDAVLIPESSIGTDQSGRYIYVVENDTVRYRSVKVGQLQRDNMREIVKGLSADEYYITQAITRVRNGQAIKPIIEQADTTAVAK
ncbi:MAG: efflux RND transporter periplasmic adaptor subunit [Paludibacteraceae bacterium]|nr:efflux RND transporter periplasmic adaptor subunit [Paludibacteraceae bacterium]